MCLIRRWWGRSNSIAAKKRKVVVEPQCNCRARFAEERLQRGLEEGVAVGIEGVLLDIDGGYFSVLGLFSGCRGC